MSQINESNEIPDNVLEILNQADITTPEDMLRASKYKLSKIGIDRNYIEMVKDWAARRLLPEYLTATECLIGIGDASSKWNRITFGSKSLDNLLNGGLLTRGITELFGSSASGKTQICLQLSLNVQLPRNLGGLERGAAYICTESHFPSSRLVQLASELPKKLRNPTVETIDFMKFVLVDHVSDVETLLNSTIIRLPILMSQNNIGLIVIDSVAGIFRMETDLITRAYNMRRMVQSLLNLADKYHCAVVCVNQVTSVISDGSRSGQLIPSLGLAWANLVNQRLQVHRIGELRKEGIVRRMEIIFSVESERNAADFLITSKGICDLP